VVEGVELPRAPGRPPLVQVTFNLTDVPDLRFSLPGVRLEPVDQQHEWAKFDLTLFAAEVPGGLRLDARYDADLFEAATIERMLARFGVLLEAACADPELRLADLPLDAELPLPAEDAGIFAEIWND
jgi:non-ribosomal peptide synthetase component F